MLSVEDLELVTEDDDLDILVVDSPHCGGEQSEQGATDQIGERDQLATLLDRRKPESLGEPAEERLRREWAAQTGRLRYSHPSARLRPKRLSLGTSAE